MLASEKEPWGLSVNEAMIGGCVPIVTKECGSAADLVDKTTGRVVDPGNAQDLSAALNELTSNPDHLAELGASTKARIQTWGLEESVEGLQYALAQLSAL